jgi:hypothetical protein
MGMGVLNVSVRVLDVSVRVLDVSVRVLDVSVRRHFASYERVRFGAASLFYCVKFRLACVDPYQYPAGAERSPGPIPEQDSRISSYDRDKDSANRERFATAAAWEWLK